MMADELAQLLMGQAQAQGGLAELLRQRPMPSQAEAMIQNWDAGATPHPNDPSMRSYEPLHSKHQLAGGVGSGLESMGMDGREAMKWGHRVGGLAETAAWPLVAARDTGRGVSQGIMNNNPTLAASSAAAGAIALGVPSAMKSMTKLPTFEASRDMDMARRLSAQGGENPVLPHNGFNSNVLKYGFPDSTIMNAKGQYQQGVGGVRPMNATEQGAYIKGLNNEIETIGRNDQLTPISTGQQKYFNELLAQQLRQGFKPVQP